MSIADYIIYLYVYCRSVQMLLKMLLEYCTCLEDLPKSAPDILNKLIEIIKVSIE